MDEKDVHEATDEQTSYAADEVNEEEAEAVKEEVSSQEEDEVEKETVLKSDYDTLKNEYDELDDRLVRVQAELQNIQRRNKRDREAASKYRSQDLAKEILPAIDNLERALSIEVDDEAGENLKKGIEMVLDNITQALNNHGIEEIQAEGQMFDPNYHEAYTQLPAQEGQESGQVAQVFEKGYILHDRVLRAAKVAVVQ